MPTTTSTILDQISAEKTKISERLARLDADREKIATQLNDPQPGVGSLIVAALFQISDNVARFRDRLVAMPLEMQARGS